MVIATPQDHHNWAFFAQHLLAASACCQQYSRREIISTPAAGSFWQFCHGVWVWNWTQAQMGPLDEQNSLFNENLQGGTMKTEQASGITGTKTRSERKNPAGSKCRMGA
ncbi:hypothetical protein ILYODFUR_029600 [Ilyodon furcidens]|uniref:Uncharacterized protein n=1 Tax=Ilyodon furcidens TaxID=33524 RepID=A0ABV0SQ98_9TELE